MKRNILFSVAAATLIAILATDHAIADDICGDLFKQGYYDESSTFTSQQAFRYIQSLLKTESDMTYSQATSSSFNLGINIIDEMDAALGGKTDSSNYEARKGLFLSYNVDTSSSSSSLTATTKVVSAAAVSAIANCWKLHPGFSITVKPKSTLDGVAVTIRDDTGDATVTKISGDSGPLKCDTPVPSRVSPPYTFNCTKPQEKTLLLTVNVQAKGTLSGIELYGTDRVIPDLINDVKALSQDAASPNCLGCISAAALSEADFQRINGAGWVLCQGQSIVGSKLQQLSLLTNAPDLRGVFLRGKNYGARPNVDEVDLSKYSADTVGPHQHKFRVTPGSDAPAGILWGGNSHLSIDPLQPLIDDGTETRPKNVTVNYFCKIN